jgi:hypothetical protein
MAFTMPEVARPPRLGQAAPMARKFLYVMAVLIALMLMELEVFKAIGGVLGLYSNIAISWIMAVVADLVVNKPLGLSPKGIEFRRAHLYDVNPVGVGAMGIASVLSIAAHLGAFGPMAQAWSAMIALVVAMVASPLIAWATGGRYYLARRTPAALQLEAADSAGHGSCLGSHVLRRCSICERDYEPVDVAGRESRKVLAPFDELRERSETPHTDPTATSLRAASMSLRFAPSPIGEGLLQTPAR